MDDTDESGDPEELPSASADAAMSRTPLAIKKALRQGLPVQDHVFDLLFPAAQRRRSWLHWTPLRVARRMCTLLAPRPGEYVLDIGSGVGKPCLVGALMTRATWFGIERDLDMVRAATDAARALGLQRRARFMLGEMELFDWSRFDAFYLFNPFAESLFATDLDALDRRARYVASVEAAQDQLSRTARGTRVITYQGFGGDMPAGFEREKCDGDLELWVHRRSRRPRAKGSES
jgi:SAM-dependent methyltransferase